MSQSPDARSLKKQLRHSNIELLRIVSMLMVLTVHIDGASLGLPATGWEWSCLSARDGWRLGVEAFAIVGVNCFTLISGYFGIRLKASSMWQFLAECLFYSIVIYLLFVTFGLRDFEWSGLGLSCLVLSHTDLWYVPAYFCLCLISPFLNAGSEKLTARQLGILTGVFVVFNFWCGWWWEGKFNPTGYTAIQLVMVYLIGRTIARVLPMNTSGPRRHYRKKVLMSAGAFVLLTFGTFLLTKWLPYAKAFAYNAPFVLGASVSCFLAFLFIPLQSKAINTLARSAFALYLVHKNPLVWITLMRPFVKGMWEKLELWKFSLLMLTFVIAAYLAVAVIDAGRRRLFKILHI